MARARSLSEFQTSFPDETSCAAFLLERRWPQGFVCPACGGTRAALLKSRVLDAADWRKLIDSIPTETVRDLRDRALIATLTYSFARIAAALQMKVADFRPHGASWRVQLQEKGGKQHAMPCHHALAAALHLYIDAAGLYRRRRNR